MRLEGKTVIVTGGSEGLGEAMAMRLAVDGARLWLIARSESSLQRVTNTIRARGMRADYCMCDVRSASDIAESVRRIIEEDLRIDVLINNAGVWLQGEIQDAPAEEVRRIFEINTMGTIFMTQAVLPVMRKQGEGHILNIISDSGVEPYADWAIYTASKYGVRGFTDALRKAVDGTRIKVTGFYPAGINTKLFINAGIPLNTSEPWMMDKADIADVVSYVLTRPDDIVIEHVVIKKQLSS